MATKKRSKKGASSSAAYKAKPYTGILAEPPPAFMLGGKSAECDAHLMRLLDALAAHYGLPPGDGDNGWRLAVSLAMDHVPAFQVGQSMARKRARRATLKGQPTRLNTVDTLRFLDDARQVIEREVAAGRKRPSDAAIGRELASREWARRLGLDPETIRKFLPAVRNSFAAVATNRATEFQRQFVEIVFPIIKDSFHSSD